MLDSLAFVAVVALQTYWGFITPGILTIDATGFFLFLAFKWHSRGNE